MTGGTAQTVTGPVAAGELGLVLPHEHLFNDLSGVRDEPSYRFSEFLVDRAVDAGAAWALRHDPYCCADNLAPKPVADVMDEIAAFQAVGGRTIVDATSSAAIGRDPDKLVEVAQRTGLNIVMGCGAYLEKFEGERISAQAVEVQAASIGDELTSGVGAHRARPGIIGEIGVSPDFTPAEQASLRAAALAQLDHPEVPLMIHLPGWQRRGDEVLDVVLDEIGVAPARVVLSHMDPSAEDGEYQLGLADRGVWLEFDMIGMDITFPKEGASPATSTTASGVARLVDAGHGEQVLLSHDVFLKQMWTRHGGNGFAYVPTIFAEELRALGVSDEWIETLTRTNPAAMLCGR
ncbi:phosphotriesterase-related protein [Saccharopolyspora sp. NPDC002686]|uniref:phosphotriesterase family protein n=1 Tax=Saccharopolyspora sp. NPDC002686 TaxID=3154541 RepID=UPI00333468DD